MRIFHIATRSDWDAARETGLYTTSTRGRTLAEEGFVHASRGDQWQGVRERFYADVTEPLVLLVIDPDRLRSPVVDEPVPDSDETFPHVYGPIDVDAVVQTIALDEAPALAETPEPAAEPTPPEGAPVRPAQAESPSFSRLYLEEMFRNVLLASVVLAAVVVTSLVGRLVDADWGALAGAALGLVVGLVGVRAVTRARRRTA